MSSRAVSSTHFTGPSPHQDKASAASPHPQRPIPSSQEHNILFRINIDHLQLLIVIQRIQYIILREESLVVSVGEELLELGDYLDLVHLLHLFLLHDVTDVIDNPGGLVLVSVSVVLF